MNRILQSVTSRLSLRKPQAESLEILATLLEKLALSKTPDTAATLEAVRALYPQVRDFERQFPSLCFALATGVGKTRLMGAFISYLYLSGASRNFFVLAPNLTIYEKLMQDFSSHSPKYVFRGISEFTAHPPILITGDNYETGIGVRGRDLFGNEQTAYINIFNISKINATENTKPGAVKSKIPKIKRLQEYIGESYFDYLAGLPDLVLLMDEAHRYRASAGAQAISDLQPILGLELTATPKSLSGKDYVCCDNLAS
ncbi:MAG: DEAD/DEAH box helicase family protein, partial [Rickettsiales bacterium]